MSFKKILGLQSDKWDNPEESIGAFVGFLRGGRYRCWEAAGKARETFRKLSPEIKNYLKTSNIPPTNIVSWSIYMIGHTEETAAPKVLICSTDLKTQKNIRKLIKDSKIMEKYPGVRLRDVSALPDRHVIRELSREVIQALLPPGCDVDGAVLAEGSELSLGKRIFIVNPNDFSLRQATAGPVILQGGNRYQLTVAHAFQHNRDPSQSSRQGAVEEDDCDFDGMSDDEGDGEIQDHELMRRGSVTPEGMDSDKGSFTSRLDRVSSQEGSDIWSKNSLSDHQSNEHDSHHPLKSVSTNPHGHGLDVSLLRFFGRLALSSVTGSNPSLDYALIKIPGMMENVNRMPWLGRNPTKACYISFDAPRKARFGERNTGPPISTIGQIGSEDIDIVAATSHRRSVEGRLTATPSYIRLPGHNTFQQVYPVRLQEPLADGDCGAAVFGKHNRHYYGHVVAGGPGTAVAYLVPASDFYRDVRARLGHGLALIPRGDEQPTIVDPSRASRKSKAQLPSEAAEDASRYPKRQTLCGIACTQENHMMNTCRTSGFTEPSYPLDFEPGWNSDAPLMDPSLTPLPMPPPSQPELVHTSTVANAASDNSRHRSMDLYSSIVVLKFAGQLEAMVENWTPEERDHRRRIVLFHKAQKGSTVHVSFWPVSTNERPPNSICISCIWWAEKDEYYVTLADIMRLLEQLVVAPRHFTVDEKIRFRRNLERFHPPLISDLTMETDQFLKTIMSFSDPKPHDIHNDAKAFHWKVLEVALKRIIRQYSNSPSSKLSAASAMGQTNDYP